MRESARKQCTHPACARGSKGHCRDRARPRSRCPAQDPAAALPPAAPFPLAGASFCAAQPRTSRGATFAPRGCRRQPPPRAGNPRGRHSPIGGVASVCRPTSWPGPNPSRKSLNWLSAPSRVVGKMNLRRGEQRAFVEHRAGGGGVVSSEIPPGARGLCPAPAPVPPTPCHPAVPYVPSELLLLVLPSVDSRLPCRVTLVLISTAMPVSVLLRMLLRSFLGPPSGNRDRGELGRHLLPPDPPAGPASKQTDKPGCRARPEPPPVPLPTFGTSLIMVWATFPWG